MGIPYSREINAAFEQVTPLVAAGFEVLQTTKNIALLLAVIQVLTVVLLFLILLALVALLCVVDPDLDRERRELVTPAVRWLAAWVLAYGRLVGVAAQVAAGAVVVGCCVVVWRGSLVGRKVPPPEGEGGAEDAQGGDDDAGAGAGDKNAASGKAGEDAKKKKGKKNK